MLLAKWGNSLAVRIPVEVAEKMNLKLGEEVHVLAVDEHRFEVVRDRRREEAIEKLRRLRFEVPTDFRFDRDEIYDR